MLKKMTLLFLSLCIQLTLLAQNSSLASAEKALLDNKLIDAKIQAEQVLNDQIAAVKSKNDKFRQKGKSNKIKPERASGETYAILGRIYAAIALSDEPSLSDISKNAVQIAIDNFNKVKEVEKETSLTYLNVFGPTLTGKQPYKDELYVNLFNKGIDVYNNNDFAAALSIFENVIIVNPNDTNAYLNAMNAAIQIDNKSKGKKFARKIIDMGRREIHFYNYLIVQATQEGNYEEALQIVQEAKKYIPNNSDLIKQEVNIYIKSEKTKEAIASLKEAIRKEPDNYNLMFYLAVLYDNSKEEEQAIQYSYKEELYINLFNKGIDVYNNNDFAAALSIYDNYIFENPNDTNAYLNAMNAALDNYNLMFYLAVLYDNSKGEEQAIQYYKKTLELNSDYKVAHYNLGALYYNQSIALAKELNNLSIDVRTGQFKDLKKASALELIIKIKYALAIPHFEKGIDSEKEKKSIWEALAVMYKNLGMIEKLKKANEKIQTLSE